MLIFVGQGHQEENGHHLEGHHQGDGQGQETDTGHQAGPEPTGVHLPDVATLHQEGDDHLHPDPGHRGPGGLKRVEDGIAPLLLAENRGENEV